MNPDLVSRSGAGETVVTNAVVDAVSPTLHVSWEAWFVGIMQFLGEYAYLLVFFGSFLENTVILGFLLPGGIAVAVASAAGREVDASLPLLFVLGTAGMAGGAVFDYLLGRLGAERVLHSPWVGRLGPLLLSKLDEAKPHIATHGWWMMLVVHAFGHGRSTLALAAGASQLSFRRFLLMEVPAALMWSAAFVGGGYMLGSEWRTITRAMNRMGWAGALVALLVVGVWFYRRRRDQGRQGGALSPLSGANNQKPELTPVGQ